MHTTIPLVTIVITCYNHQKFILKCINSVINQTYNNINIIIIDDYSNDQSVLTIQNFIKNYPKITFFKNQSNFGHTKSFNQVLDLCETDYIMDLAGDDFLESNCIEKLIETYGKINHSEYFAVYSNCNLVSDNNEFIETYYPKNYSNKIDENAYAAILDFRNRMCSVSALLNYKIFKTLGGYDSSLAYEDLDYWIRALRNYKIKYISDILVNKTVLQSSLYRSGFKRSSLARKINLSTLKILTKAFGLNQCKKEDYLLLSRIKFEMKKNIKIGYFDIFAKLLILDLKCRFRFFKLPNKK
jgi:glycosyltransferase involved in cell wall biosynthesis